MAFFVEILRVLLPSPSTLFFIVSVCQLVLGVLKLKFNLNSHKIPGMFFSSTSLLPVHLMLLNGKTWTRDSCPLHV